MSDDKKADVPKQAKSSMECVDGIPVVWEDDVFRIDNTPKNLSKSPFGAKPSEKALKREYLKPGDYEVKGATRADDAVQ